VKTLLVCICLASVILLHDAWPKIAYVYATSMEPVIHRNDGFLVWPSETYKVGDIILYRPSVLPAPRITHRIIRIGANGFITQGDNAPFPDQDSHEPEVQSGQVVGKVITVYGRPLTLPQLGRLKRKWIGISCIALAAIGLVRASANRGRKRRSVRRSRRWKPLLPIAVFGIVTGMSLAGGSTAHVPAHQQNPPSFLVKNRGVVPVLNVTSGAQVVVLRAFEEKKISVGPTDGGIHSANIPYVLPKSWLLALNRESPMALRVGVAGLLGAGAAGVVGGLARIRLVGGRRP
jgi:signal peptidase I